MPEMRGPTAALAALALLGGIDPSGAQQPAAAPAQSPESDQVAGERLKSGANSFVDSQARAILERHGFADVSPLVNGSDGVWRGTATKDNRRVEVSVDYQGHVAAK